MKLVNPVRSAGIIKVNGRPVPRFLDDKGNVFVRNERGELVRPDALKKFKKSYPLPENLAQVAVEVMGDLDPVSLSEDVRIEKMKRFFSEAFEHAQEQSNPNLKSRN